MALGLILFAVILDPTIVGPRHSDPTNQICTSPLRFLRSLDSDLTNIGYSGLVIQQPLSLLLAWKNFYVSKTLTFDPSMSLRLGFWKLLSLQSFLVSAYYSLLLLSLRFFPSFDLYILTLFLLSFSSLIFYVFVDVLAMHTLPVTLPTSFLFLPSMTSTLCL
jgi:hypothetical protein